jgi:N-methylhydantoinase A
VLRWADMRYERQLHDVRVLLPGPTRAGSLRDDMARAFADRYGELFGSTATLASSTARVLRIGVDAVAPSGVMPGQAPDDALPAHVEPESNRQVFWPEAGAWLTTAVHDGDTLQVGDVVTGPAVVEQPGTTVVVPPDAAARVDRARNLVITLSSDGGRA